IIAAVNAVIATAYYITVMREMWMKPVPDGDVTPVKVPASLSAAIALCGVATLVFGVVPGLIAKAGSISDLYGAFVP
ncbi:MAG: NADH-quinone oxidoreductase subunit N, partial [Ilumatobacteraceae bacterium]|nr:NADH-quinone oxidoreductase subunit N [Ilumatobacteraceae bacterium]